METPGVDDPVPSATPDSVRGTRASGASEPSAAGAGGRDKARSADEAGASGNPPAIGNELREGGDSQAASQPGLDGESTAGNEATADDGVAAGEAGLVAAATAVAADSEPADSPAAWIAEAAVTLVLLVFITTTLAQTFVIPSQSMEDTLMVGDHILVDKLTYAPSGPISRYLLPYAQVQRGDIVIFRYPEDIQQTFVKRVIGIPGDHIRMENKQVYLNGQPVRESYKFIRSGYDAYRDTFPIPGYSANAGGAQMLEKHVVKEEVVVPDNCYFVMGDNRDSSLDSRFWGFVPRENIIGKPLLIYWSYQTTGDRLTGPLMSLDHLKDLGRNFFWKTRWNRTFQIIRPAKVE